MPTTNPASGITPAQFIAKWERVTLPERAASQEHFIDLCRLLGQPTPAEHDATGAELGDPEMIARTYRAAVVKAGEDPAMQECLPTEMDVRGALMNIAPVWEVLFPREQGRIVKLLVEKVVINPDSMDVVIRTNGLSMLVAELKGTVDTAEGRKVSV